MKIHDHVLYIDAWGAVSPRTVTGVVGAGASGYKRLDLGVDVDVPHANDQTSGCGYWILPAEAVPAAQAVEPPPVPAIEPEDLPLLDTLDLPPSFTE